MDYRMGVQDFLRANVNLQDFYAKLEQELKALDRKYNLFVTMAKPERPSALTGKLKGLPVSVKDCICVKGLQSSAGSRILEGYEPSFDATAVARVKGENGVVIGKTNQDEFGFGTFSANSGFGIPKNPHDTARCAGGSSGGAAALTAALEYPHIALGQSTGGSISCPASFCGVAGLTPTYGLVSRYGLIDYANSLDKIGALGKTVRDAALMLSVIAGHDERDSTSLQEKQKDYARGLEAGAKGLKIGVPKEYFGPGVDRAVAGAVWEGIKKLEGLGAKVHEISLPHTNLALPAYYIIAAAEASTNLAKFCGMRYGSTEPVEGSFNEYFSSVRSKYFGREAKRRIMLGTYARMAGYRDQYYLKALKLRTLIIEDFRKAFKTCDVLAAPTMPVIAPKFSEIEKLSPVEQYMMDILTVAPNLAGIPMLSVPCGKAKGMPVGLHLMGDYLQEEKILRAGKAMEAG
jgi:aspartyl-tRNA(Asn)/glutamyl-tRNA(Gln) amidotransferase subunit A